MSIDDTMPCILFLLPDHYQGPFDGKQHNLGIRKQTGSGKLNREFGVLRATCVIFYDLIHMRLFIYLCFEVPFL